MVNQITKIFTLTQEQENHIALITDAKKPDEWERGTNMMRGIRSSITTQLDTIQNKKCCYCGLQLWETGRGEVDHIAPKASRQKPYPQFTFEKQNLALSCEYCNGSNKKGEKNVVLQEDVIYANCKFKLVHPYFDNPNQHYEWINQRTKIVIRHRSWKGLYSIIIFQLKDQANARAKQRIFERRVNRINAINSVYDRFKKIILFSR
jgi:uncharacterized protein (TIGR02646 family)